jgi:hypothetical protein
MKAVFADTSFLMKPLMMALNAPSRVTGAKRRDAHLAQGKTA